MWKYTKHEVQTCEDDDCDTFTFFKISNGKISSDYVQNIGTNENSISEIVHALNAETKNISFEEGYFGKLCVGNNCIYSRAKRSNELKHFFDKIKIENARHLQR